jgi:hypothetical protein
MSDTPETIAAILAEMREAGRSDEHADGPLIEDYADRIEAAAKRERVEREFAHKKVEEALSDEISIRDEKIKQSAPGNAAALSEALERIRPLVRATGTTPYVPERKELVDGALAIIDAALAALPEPPSNAAAMREALANVERVAKYCAETPRHTPGYPTDAARADVIYSRIAELGRVASAAIAAPARNCDRFKTAVDAMEEWNKYPQSRYKGCRVCPHGDASMVSPAHLTLAEWLFAQAEGGSHA